MQLKQTADREDIYMRIVVEKYHGLGNDYLVYDCQKNTEELDADKIRKICDRNFGVGSDGILAGPYIEDGEFAVRVFNPDGSEAKRAGNGIRIFAKYLKDAGYTLSERLTIRTKGGKVQVRFLNADGTRIQADMGKLSFSSKDAGLAGEAREALREKMVFVQKEYDCSCASMGNTHCVIPMAEISREKVCTIGAFSERSAYFGDRVNTQIMKVLDKNNIQIEIFERGVGYTLASGTSSCAAAGVAYKLGMIDSDVMVHMPGGKLWIQIDEDWHVMMTGSVQSVCRVEMTEDFLRFEP